MSYAMAAALQEAVYQHLSADPDLAAEVGGAIFDAAPTGDVPDIYVTLGPEEASAAGDQTGDGAKHRFTIAVVSDGGGFHRMKRVAGVISDALHHQTPGMSRGRIVLLQFRRANARRIKSGSGRRIDLQFEARLEDD
ncbi:uncharacterized protein DUF3168 [Aliiruegeria haliotis]|uniref:Uncharacterized protein DUF3168 n=1 Tax=Aliiruegeria haliotis TaxID=1280846 RepID=A0A2T0RYF5_9RHOB|nr:DUF3168 domain-containing protein [Aliiruegeria haliotis]PRY26215.1 uncharacterized protein DUF3168 [Aliiruegeria haliotis]